MTASRPEASRSHDSRSHSCERGSVSDLSRFGIERRNALGLQLSRRWKFRALRDRDPALFTAGYRRHAARTIGGPVQSKVLRASPDAVDLTVPRTVFVSWVVVLIWRIVERSPRIALLGDERAGLLLRPYQGLHVEGFSPRVSLRFTLGCDPAPLRGLTALGSEFFYTWLPCRRGLHT
jgi:hypothetical protein